MKKIIDKFEILDLYIKEFPYKIKQLAESRHGELKIMMNPTSFHFRKFQMKHFFLNQWKGFLNWCEVKFFPELAAPRFEKKPLGGIVKPEKPKEEERIAYKYKQLVAIKSGFYQGMTGVIQRQCSDSYGLLQYKYEVEIISKTGSEIVEIWGDTMKPIGTESSKKS